MKHFFFLLFVVVHISANAADIEKVIGSNDLIAVDKAASNIPLRYKNKVDAFGFMAMGCTATHIGRGYVLTAGHCFWAPPELTEHYKCDDTVINWGIRGESPGYLISKCVEIVAAQYTAGLDFAILKVDPAPDVFIAPELNRKAVIGDSLTVFSHPDEMPLHWSQMCGVERLQDPIIPEGQIQHKCDTNPGSSGATLLNALSLKIVGIHDGGRLNESGEEGMNYGTFIMNSPIYEILKGLGFD